MTDADVSAPDIDQVVRAAWNTTAPNDQWIVEIAEDHVIVTDEKDRSFARVPVLVGDTVEFGQPVKVTPGFVEVAAAAPVRRVVFASRAESRPDVAATVLDSPSPIEQQPPNPIQPVEPQTPTGPPPTQEEPQTPPDEGGVSVSPAPSDAESDEQVQPDPKEGGVSTLSTDVRSRLGLSEDADDAAILAALDGLKEQATKPTEPTPEQVAAAAASDREKDELRKEVSVLASQMQTVTAELAAAKAKEAAVVKASVLDGAQKLGKFTPAERAQWEADYDEAPGAITRTLDRIAPGTAVPVTASGYTGTGDESNVDDEYEQLVARIDGPYATKEA